MWMEARIRPLASVLVSSLVLALVLVPGRGVAASRPHAVSHDCVFDHSLLRTAPGICQPRAKSYPKTVNTPVERAVFDSARLFGVPYKLLLGIAECESDLNPYASNGSHYGLFQFLPSTFRNGRLMMRSMTGVVARSPWRPLDASYVAGFLFAYGEATSWSCLKW